VGDLVAGQGDLVRRPEAVGVLGGCGDGKGRGGEHGEGDPPVPRGPAADLVLIQAGQALSGLEILFDGPAEPGDCDQGGQRDLLQAVAPVEGQFPGVAVAADQQVPVSRAGVADGDPGPVIPAMSFSAGTCGQPLPGLPGQARGQLISPDGVPAPAGTR
jgi:hypothetical protein